MPMPSIHVPAFVVRDGENIGARPCGCGNIQVSFGPVSAHFTEAALLELAEKVEEALRELRYRSLDNPVDMGVRSPA